MSALPLVQPAPRTRAECVDGQRPCPHVGCRYHLAEIAPRASETCALDVADRGDHEVSELASLLGVSEKNLASVEAYARSKLGRFAEALDFGAHPSRPPRERLQDALRAHGPLGRHDLAELLDESDENITKLLTTLKRSGVVEQPSFNVWQLAERAR